MDATNKKILELFVEREILADVTDFVEYVIDTATRDNCPPFNPDAIMADGGFMCSSCGAGDEHQDFHTITVEEVVPILDYSADTNERFQCPHCGLGYPTKEEAKACCSGNEVVICTNCGNSIPIDEYFSDAEVDISCVNQWILVTPWMARKLSECGEIMIPEKNIWGRQDEGEVIEDDVILQVCNEIGILKGQENDWSKRLCS